MSAMNVVKAIPDLVRVRNVLISVFDKTGLPELVVGLLANCPGVRIWSTGGTYLAIKEILGDQAGAHLGQVSDFTGQPEMQGGLVKTLDYKIYLGLLSEPNNTAHENDIKRVGGLIFDLTIVNLYPFNQTIAKAGISLEEARGYIDIGGPTMLRASAKNYLRVAVVCDIADYAAVIHELHLHQGELSLATRFRLSAKVYATTSAYDAAIASYLASQPVPSAFSCYSVS